MVAGTSARESVKEMKRLKNEPLLLLVIIAIILFVGIFVIYPVVKVILFPDGGTYLELFNRPRWLTAIKNSLFMTLVSTISRRWHFCSPMSSPAWMCPAKGCSDLLHCFPLSLRPLSWR